MSSSRRRRRRRKRSQGRLINTEKRLPVVGSCRVDPIPRKLEVPACTPPPPTSLT